MQARETCSSSSCSVPQSWRRRQVSGGSALELCALPPVVVLGCLCSPHLYPCLQAVLASGFVRAEFNMAQALSFAVAARPVSTGRVQVRLGAAGTPGGRVAAESPSPPLRWLRQPVPAAAARERIAMGAHPPDRTPDRPAGVPPAHRRQPCAACSPRCHRTPQHTSPRPIARCGALARPPSWPAVPSAASSTSRMSTRLWSRWPARWVLGRRCRASSAPSMGR